MAVFGMLRARYTEVIWLSPEPAARQTKPAPRQTI